MESWSRRQFSKLAKKAPMMKDEILTYSLTFPKFAIDFDVNKKLSIEWTRSSNTYGSDFVFAVAETWLRIQGSRHLIEPAIHAGNLVEELKDFSAQLSNPLSVPNLENIILRGTWCAWMRGYWDRLNNDCNTVDDEENYDLLIPLSLMDSRKGHIVAYKFYGIPTIEVATRSEEGDESVNVWSDFDPEKLARKTLELR